MLPVFLHNYAVSANEPHQEFELKWHLSLKYAIITPVSAY